MRDFRHMQVVIALLRDGFHPQSAGGTVRLRDDGTPVLDYPLGAVRVGRRAPRLPRRWRRSSSPRARRTCPRAWLRRAVHEPCARRKAAIAAFDLRPLYTRVVSAHVMGGAPLGADPRRAVVDVTGRHHQLRNLYVCDGSLFPTSIGANPQLSIYGFAARIAIGLLTLGARV